VLTIASHFLVGWIQYDMGEMRLFLAQGKQRFLDNISARQDEIILVNDGLKGDSRIHARLAAVIQHFPKKWQQDRLNLINR